MLDRRQPGRRKLPQSNEAPLPEHIAIIMDGNGRWAVRQRLPRTAGHKAGAETFRRIATYCKNIGVKYLTVYAFSTENWKRSETEVSAIMGLLKRYLLEAVDTMERDHIRLLKKDCILRSARMPMHRPLAHRTSPLLPNHRKNTWDNKGISSISEATNKFYRI